MNGVDDFDGSDDFNGTDDNGNDGYVMNGVADSLVDTITAVTTASSTMGSAGMM